MLTLNISKSVKGGVGKSLFTRGLCAYCEEKKIPHLSFEANQDTPDLAGFYPEILEHGRIFEFSRGDDIDAPNIVINAMVAQQVHSIVNMPAAGESSFEAWAKAFDVFTVMKENNIRMINWFVTSGDPDSIDSLKESIDIYGSDMQHVVVTNLKFMKPGQSLGDEILELLEKNKAPVIEMAAIPKRIQDFVLAKQLQYIEATTFTDPKFGLMDRGAIRGFLNKLFAAIDSTKIFDGATTTTASKPQPAQQK
jgi:hypothetical protein